MGHAALFTQAGVPAGYDAIDLRRFLAVGLQEGVVDAGSYKVTQRGAGANMSVDIAASTGLGALVQGDSVTAQGLYSVPPHTAVINEAITTAHATLPRLDQVVLELLDDTHAGGGLNKARVRVIAGTATSGATLDNRSGAAALPSSAVRLADVIVAAADASIIDAEIRDRRPWVRGAFRQVVRNSNAAAGNDYTSSSTSFAEVDSTNLKFRIECSGVPVRVTFQGNVQSSGAAGTEIQMAAMLDGVVMGGGPHSFTQEPVSGHFNNMAFLAYVVPSAGSRLWSLAWKTSASTLALLARAAFPTTFTVEELARQDAANG